MNGKQINKKMFIFVADAFPHLFLNTFCKSLFFLSKKRPRIFKKIKQEKIDRNNSYIVRGWVRFIPVFGYFAVSGG